MGNWWLAASSRQCPLHLRFGALCLLAFPKPKITFERERFQTVSEIQENVMGQLMVTGRTVWGPKCLLRRGMRCQCPMYNVSCILYPLQYMSLFFILHDWIPSGQTSYVCYRPRGGRDNTIFLSKFLWEIGSFFCTPSKWPFIFH